MILLFNSLRLKIHKMARSFSNRKKILIYTDGSHKGRWGSWAYVVVVNTQIIHEASGRQRHTNSHQMEFQAAIEALKYLKPGSRAQICSDSKELIRAATHTAKRPATNQAQALEIDRLQRQNQITWKWVKAHSGLVYNERCDELCIQARMYPKSSKISQIKIKSRT